MQDGPFKPFVGLVASNYLGRQNDVDINSITLKNMDPRVYSDKQALNNQRLKLLAERNGYLSVDKDGKKIAHDLLSIHVEDVFKREQRKNLLFFDGDDDVFELLFKYYKTVKNYEALMNDLLDRYQRFLED